MTEDEHLERRRIVLANRKRLGYSWYEKTARSAMPITGEQQRAAWREKNRKYRKSRAKGAAA